MLKVYIVSSGDGYFIEFANDTPVMDSDPVCATRMERVQAERIVERLGKLGFVGKLVHDG